MTQKIYQFRWIFISFIIILLIISGCKSVSVLPSKTPINNIKIKELGNEISKAKLNYKNIRSRIKTEYDDGNRKQQIILNLRMVDKKAIWISATMLIPIGKLLITPDKISFYEKFQRTFYEGDLTFIKKFLNINIDFNDIQNILLGYPILNITDNKWKRISHPKFYVLSLSGKAQNFTQTLFFDPTNFLLMEQRFFLKSLNQNMTIKYNYFQKVDGKNIPRNIEFFVPYDSSYRKLILEYTRVDFPEDLNLPFTIPDGYKPINILEK
tara:strand:+ start:1403 stop:2203 length:801 start_codon:yes stop_codon:yes gene_type:complete